MDVIVAGAHGQIAMLLHPLLITKGHRVRGLIRNPEHSDEVKAAGAQPEVCDLEEIDDLASQVGTADMVIFAAGAGPGSGIARKTTMDHDGAVKLISAAKRNHIKHFIMISAMHAEAPRGNEVFRVYLQAKSRADKTLRTSGLNYTIIRPGRLTDQPATGRVSLAAMLPEGDIPRADVADVIAQVVDSEPTDCRQFDLISGDQPIVEALGSL